MDNLKGISRNLTRPSFQRKLESSPFDYSRTWMGLGPSLRWDDGVFRNSLKRNTSIGATSRLQMAGEARQRLTFSTGVVL